MNWLSRGLRSYPHETNLNRFMGYLLILYHSDFQTGVAHFHHALRTTLANLHEIEINKSELIEKDVNPQLNTRYTKAKHKIIRELAYYVALSPVPLPGHETLVSQKDVEEWLKPRFPELLKDNEFCLASDSAYLMRFTLLARDDAGKFRHLVATQLMKRDGKDDSAANAVQAWMDSPENKKKVNEWLYYYTGNLFHDYEDPSELKETSQLSPNDGDCHPGQFMKPSGDSAEKQGTMPKMKDTMVAQDKALLTNLLAILRGGVRQELVNRAGLKEAERLLYSISSPSLQMDSKDQRETARVYGLVLLVRNGEYECPKRGKAINEALKLFMGARDQLSESPRPQTEAERDEWAEYNQEVQELDLQIRAASDLACPDNEKGESAMWVPHIN